MELKKRTHLMLTDEEYTDMRHMALDRKMKVLELARELFLAGMKAAKEQEN